MWLSLLLSGTIFDFDVFIWGLIMSAYQYLQLRQAEDNKLVFGFLVLS